MRKLYYIYLLTNAHHTVLYTGITGDLVARVWQHKQKQMDGFTKRYNADKLIYYEEYQDIRDATDRENN